MNAIDEKIPKGTAYTKVSTVSRKFFIFIYVHIFVCYMANVYVCALMYIYLSMSTEFCKIAQCTLNCGSRSNEFVSQLGAGLICFLIYLA